MRFEQTSASGPDRQPAASQLRYFLRRMEDLFFACPKSGVFGRRPFRGRITHILDSSEEVSQLARPPAGGRKCFRT